MKIKKISAEQFSGLRDAELSFKDGLNVVYGPNEAGKSTLVSLIENTLFKDAKIGNKSIEDTAFKKNFYPSADKNGNAAQNADADVHFETNNGLFKLHKEWDAEGSVKLIAPAALYKNKNEVESVLSPELIFGKALYKNVLLSPQKNDGAVLSAILEGSAAAGDAVEAKEELEKKLTEVFAGVKSEAVERLEKTIAVKKEELGKGWDVSISRPAQKVGGGNYDMKRYGTVAAEYINKAEAESKKQDILAVEKKLTELDANCKELAKKLDAAKAEYEDFDKAAGELKTKSLLEAKLKSAKDNLAGLKSEFDVWPKADAAVKNAKLLEAELENAKLIQTANSAEEADSQIARLTKEINDLNKPQKSDVKRLKILENNIEALETKLKGINISLDVDMQAGYTAEFKTVKDGTLLEPENGKLNITEAVIMTIPGVAQIQICAAGVDPKEVQNDIAEARSEAKNICTEFNVKDSEELEANAVLCEDKARELDGYKNTLAGILNGKTLDEVKSAAAAIPSCRAEADIKSDIQSIISGSKVSDIYAYEAVNAAECTKLTDKYSTFALLQALISDKQTEIDADEKSLAGIGSIPAAYSSVADPDAYLKQLKDTVELLESQKQNADSNRISAETNYLNGKSSFEIEEEIAAATAKYNSSIEEYNHWLHIESVYESLKNSALANPVEGLADAFIANLNALTDYNVEGVAGKDTLDFKLFSKGHNIDYDKLSDGTKDCVSLAYKLAVIDTVFPDGAFCVLDDAINNMDSKREAAAIELLQNLSTRHQLIYMTCKEEMKSKLGGNIIELK